MEPLQAGRVVNLEVGREVPFGYFLTDGDQEVLLHETEANRELASGETITVFLYRDKKDRLAATMTIPNVSKDTYEWLPVVEVRKSLGVFLDIGIKRDVLLSIDDLPEKFELWPKISDKLYCCLQLDKKGRLLAKRADEERMDGLTRPAIEAWFNHAFTGTIYRLVWTGSFMISDDGIQGFIHESEQEQEQRLGKKVTGRVIGVKEDGSVNVSLLPRKQERMGEDAEAILSHLQSRGGPMPYTDRTHPDDIQKIFGISKGAFKRALGRLMKERKVYQKDGWTHINKEQD